MTAPVEIWKERKSGIVLRYKPNDSPGEIWDGYILKTCQPCASCGGTGEFWQPGLSIEQVSENTMSAVETDVSQPCPTCNGGKKRCLKCARCAVEAIARELSPCTFVEECADSEPEWDICRACSRRRFAIDKAIRARGEGGS